jgi:hypothetical protein
MALKFSRLFATITDNCDYSCKHCYMSASPKAEQFMNDKVFERMIDLYSENLVGSGKIKISGGDPLNHPKFKDFVSYAVAQIPDVELGVLTTDNMFKRDARAFRSMVEFLQANNLRYISFNADVNFRKGSSESLQAAQNICIDVASNGSPFYTVADFSVDKPYFFGSAQRRIPLRECNTIEVDKCDSFAVEEADGDQLFPMNVTVNGQLQYCLFGIGKYAHVFQNITEISERLLDKKIFQALQKSMKSVFDLASSVDDKYDHLPPNCSRAQAILEDPALVRSIEDQL